ncbi:choice-of-anchor D domain-containing protein [Solirubrobacter ginsenosidimutans]|uniref:Choice-of-anchor D domain-containing protein n=1 Tax=Solirubrobacter ginsenosidimutans TaxID=490573 RepID=A0A9X3MW83_9ACTN|nr:choice-of-anchor D domain-containing protein [Solirubrobacter ginsenosidimutans]MDA0163824.1 choice-of-anchor D domain-containing protein [Solirubrobacter ginsenosidimutans]
MNRRTLLQLARATAAAAIALAALGTPAALATINIPTTTTITPSVSPLVVSGPVVYTVAVSPVPSGGTVTVFQDSQPVAGCAALALTNGVTTCTTTAPVTAGNHSISSLYSGFGQYDPSPKYLYLPVATPSKTVVTASPKLADPGATMTYIAKTTPRPPDGGVSSACAGGCGAPVETVDFALDGAPIAGCLLRPVDLETGIATCKTSVAPAAGGKHTVTASYVGNDDSFLTTSQGTDDFEVTAPGISTSSSTLAFGSVKVGATGTQQVTVTNSGTRTLSLGGVTVSGPFTIASSTCADTLAAGASCVITLAFAPAATGDATGALTIASDAGSPEVALTATGVAAPTSTPPSGATLPPNAKTTFTATTSSAGGPSTVTVPLRCPNGVACTLDGTVVISTDDLLKNKTVRAAAVATQTVARFSGVRVAAGKVREIKLKLSPAFIKAAQKRGIRLIHATLTVNTTFTDGSKATRQEHVVIRIPKAAAKKEAAPKQAPRFTG